ncbi:HAMP domain-containing histidine kinase [Dactylosporangium aurantiacum]|uniref:histidine kinase n=1 Tax=Dactylosporangium aurantiacum TaxID=35754 RepID=A0A9Q9MC77_9ACTN|nr:HAMP domain-containing sensor histidine kinase [Dactylosporangium aurantiacum]MDG6108078.1 HAMP domain-containing sensor histidine kinase [Dactylosporangium aurantiacum]UWZ53708.1 HAMP domain-containing histidine kinase [Dactylosporangium aurantiacum]
MNRLTIRARLTLVHGGLFLLAGLVLLAVTYALVYQRLSTHTLVAGISADLPPGLEVPPPDGAMYVKQIKDNVTNETGRVLLTQGGIALGVIALAATAFGWLIAGRLLQPLHQVTATARRIADAPDRGLHERIALQGPQDEVKQLADTFDVMLARLDQAFDGQRRFIANASHELRTPLTLNRTLLEVAIDPDNASPELRQLGRTLLAVNARHEQLIDGLLLLARSERAVTDRSFVDLADIVEHVTAQLPPGKATVDCSPQEAPTTGNAVLLERLVHNLVENGVRHNLPDGGWVHVTSGTRPDGTVAVTVSNTGPVVPRYEVPRLFEPFRRFGPERVSAGVPGAGLGLSIVRAVARAHGGSVHAEPRDGGGLVVTVILPTAPPDGAGFPT